MRASFTVRWNPLGLLPPTSRPPLLVLHICKFEIPVLLVRSGEATEAIQLRARARLVTKKLMTFSRPAANLDQIVHPLRACQNMYPSASERYKYFEKTAEQVLRIAGSAVGGDIRLYYEMTVYMPVEAAAIEVAPGGQLAFTEKGVRKIRYGEVGDNNEESSSHTACCAICLEEFGEGEEAVSLTCSHVLHGMCLERWFRRKHQCPLCRREIMWFFAAELGL